MKLMKVRKAFTIVEMVIVIAVIAILATVLVPTISGVIDKANHSADQQFVASLNIQLALWQVDNGQIENESDLRVAINSYYGEEGEDFYASLAPKSANRGYHFWFSAADQQVVLAKYEELLDDVAPIADVEPTFSPASPRSLIIGQKNYFLMDQSGSELANYLVALNDISAVGDHATIIGNIDLLDDDAALADLIADKLEITAIANDYGMFFDNGTATYVYIPTDTVLLGEANVRGDLSGVTEIYLPDGVKLGSNSLEGFTATGTDHMQPDTWVGSTVIYANLTAGQVSSFVSTNAFDCVLEIPTGERYVFVGGQLKQLGSGASISTNYSTALESFVVTGTDNEKADMHFGAVNEIHYAADYTGTFTLQVQDFADENGACPARPVTWEGVGDAVVNADGSITLTNQQLKAATTIVVRSTDGVEYTFNVKAVAVDGISLKVNNLSNVSNQFSFEYNNTGVTYTLAATVYVTDNITCVKPSITPVISIDGILTYGEVTEAAIEDESGNAAYQYTTTLSFVNSKQTGNVAANLSVTAGSVSRTGNISLKDTIQTAFVIADNANTQTKYGIQFTVGTVNEISLDTLFAPATSDALNGRTAISYTATIGSEPLSSGSGLTAETWKSATLDLSTVDGNGTLTVVINDGLKSTTFTAAVKAGAYNVATDQDWIDAPDGNIAVLKDITLADKTEQVKGSGETSSGMSSISGSGYYSKTIGANTIYGNYCTINTGNFKIIPYSYKKYSIITMYAYSNNYFLKITSGKLDKLIINGPDYDKRASTRTGSEGKAGYYVSGVETGSGTIDNCYISGFRSPIYVQGNTKITNSVIDGGAFANIYIHGTCTLTLTNVETYQYAQSGAKIGAGIFIDNNESASTTVTLNATNLKQNNFYTSDQIKEIGNSIASGAGTLVLNNVGTLAVDGYYHSGIITWTETKNITTTVTKVNNYTVATCSQSNKNASIYGLGDNCPTRVSNYSIDDNFCFAKYTDSYKATIAQ